jgi:hypothetical protein
MVGDWGVGVSRGGKGLVDRVLKIELGSLFIVTRATTAIALHRFIPISRPPPLSHILKPLPHIE